MICDLPTTVTMTVIVTNRDRHQSTKTNINTTTYQPSAERSELLKEDSKKEQEAAADGDNDEDDSTVRKPLTQTMVAVCGGLPGLPSLADGEGWVVSDLIRVWDLVSVFHKTIGVTPFEMEDLIGSLSYVGHLSPTNQPANYPTDQLPNHQPPSAHHHSSTHH